MKKKYEKPTIIELKIPLVNAQGFETMDICSDGASVADTAPSCNTGSSDTASGSQCSNGDSAGTICNTGSSN